MVKNTKKIPFSYQEVQYIESSNTQWIDTGISLNNNCGIKCKAMYLSKPSAHADVCGFIVGPLASGATVNWRIQGGNPAMFFSNNLSGTGVTGNYYYAFSANSWYELAMNERGSGNVVLDGVTLGACGSFSGSYDIYLFGSNNIYGGNIVYGMASIRIASFIAYGSNGKEMANLVPCYRKSDNVVGMYDTVRGLFLTNSGSGSFTKGANV